MHIKKHIDENFSDPDLTLDRLSKDFQLLICASAYCSFDDDFCYNNWLSVDMLNYVQGALKGDTFAQELGYELLKKQDPFPLRLLGVALHGGALMLLARATGQKTEDTVASVVEKSDICQPQNTVEKEFCADVVIRIGFFVEKLAEKLGK